MNRTISNSSNLAPSMINTRSETAEEGDTRLIGKHSSFTFPPRNHGNLVSPPEFKVERSGRVLYNFDLRKIAGMPGGLDYTLNLGSQYIRSSVLQALRMLCGGRSRGVMI